MRDDRPPYPLRAAYFRFLALALSLAALFYLMRAWNRQVAPFERFYVGSYIRTTLPEIPYWHTYTVVIYRGTLALPTDPGPFTQRKQKLNRAKLREWLRANIYGGRSLASVLRWPLAGFLLAFFALVGLANWTEQRINGESRAGRLVRGPRLISKWRFNLRTLLGNRGFHIETK